MKFSSVDAALFLFFYLPASSLGCILSELPNDLLHNLGSGSGAGSGGGYYDYGDIIDVKCRDNLLFVENTYQLDMKITCHRVWSISKYECAIGCTRPYHYAFQIDLQEPIASGYKVNTAFTITCKTGRMYHMGPPSYFTTSSAQTVCESNGKWRYDNIGCWTDQVVDFTSPRQTLIANEKTLFACASTMSSHKVKIGVGETVIQTEFAAWEVMQVTSKLNQVVAYCEVADSFGVLRKRETILDVIFAPELPQDAGNLQFDLTRDKTDYIIIEFIANPVLPLSSVSVTKNGNKIQNYYLSVEEFNHKVVVHFIKVEEADFGDYALRVSSFSPSENVLEANFTISRSTSSSPLSAPLNGTQGAFIALGTVVAVILVVFAVFMLGPVVVAKMSMRNKQNSCAVTYQAEEPDHNNYEDIEEKQKDDRSDYVNIKMGGSATPNEYVLEKNAEEENPYIIPNN